MKSNLIISFSIILAIVGLSCGNDGDSVLNTNNKIQPTLSSKYYKIDCDSLSVVNLELMDSLFNEIFSKNGNLLAYNKAIETFRFYKKEYLLLSMAIKYSNLYNSPQASFDVYSMISNFYEYEYFKPLLDCRSKKIAYFYLFKCYNEDPNDSLSIKILEKAFGNDWVNYKNSNFLDFKECDILPNVYPSLGFIGGRWSKGV